MDFDGAILRGTVPTVTLWCRRNPLPDPERARLTGFASLPADTFVPGSEKCGYFTTNAGVPFPGQPVQGFSGIHALAGGDYLVMSDNGSGAKANSQDFQLRVHRIRPDLSTGTVAVLPAASCSPTQTARCPSRSGAMAGARPWPPCRPATPAPPPTGC